MSDPLKKYIQQAKHRFDVEQPDADLFKKIMSKLEEDNFKQHAGKRSFIYTYQRIAIAASLILFVACGIFLFNDSNKTTATSDELTSIQQHEPSSESTKNVDHQNNQSGQQQTSISYTNQQSLQSSTPSLNSDEQELDINKNNLQNIALKTPVVQNEMSITQGKVASTSNNPPAETTEVIGLNLPVKITVTETSPIAPETVNRVVNSTNQIANSSDGLLKQDLVQPSIAQVHNNKTSNNITTEDQSLKEFIKNGFFNVLSKKAKKWSGDALSIENQGKKEETILALHFKNEKFEFSKSIHF